MDHAATDDVEFTHRFVATSDTRRQCALAFVRHVHRARTTWVLYSALLMPFTVLIFSGMDERFSLELRLVWALIFALAPTLVVAGCFAALGYVRTLRGAPAAAGHDRHRATQSRPPAPDRSASRRGSASVERGLCGLVVIMQLGSS